MKSKAARLKVLAASAAKVMDQSPSKASPQAPTVVEVDLGNRSYPIYIGSGLLDRPDLLQRYFCYAFCSFNFIQSSSTLTGPVTKHKCSLLLDQFRKLRDN